MRSESPRPMYIQESPPSMDLKTPPPTPALFRGFPSPVPAQTMSGFGWNTATEPIPRTG